MKIIELNDRIIYRAEENNRVMFEGGNKLYSEISIDKDDVRVVKEVKDVEL